jgi:hypothetical protein
LINSPISFRPLDRSEIGKRRFMHQFARANPGRRLSGA